MKFGKIIAFILIMGFALSGMAWLLNALGIPASQDILTGLTIVATVLAMFIKITKKDALIGASAVFLLIMIGNQNGLSPNDLLTEGRILVERGIDEAGKIRLEVTDED